MCIRIYIFNFKTNKQTNKQKKQENKKQKKLEKKREYLWNIWGDTMISFANFCLCTFYLLDQMVDFFWLFIYDVLLCNKKI